MVRAPESLLRGAWALAGLAVVWLALSALLVLVYAKRYGFLATLVLPHLVLVLTGLLAVLSGVLLIAKLPVSVGWRRIFLTLWLATLHAVLLLAYALCFLAWEVWNQPPSLSLALAYVPQLKPMLATLPISRAALISGAVVLVVILVLPYALLSGVLLNAAQVAWLQGTRHIHSWTPTWRLALLPSLALAVPLILLGGLWERRLSMAAVHEPFAQAVWGADRAIGAMTLDAASTVRALEERALASQYVAPPLRHRKTLVLITVDALRADQTSVVGPWPMGRDTTPFLRRLHEAGRLTRFSPAYSVCAESFCGLLGVLTSQYWHRVTLGGFGLTGVLKRLGYRTTFFLSGDHTSFYGLRTAYGDAIDDFRDGSMSGGYPNDDEQVLANLRAWSPDRNTPQFLYIHLMSVHALGTRHETYRRWSPHEVGMRSMTTEALVPAYVNNYHNGVLQVDALIERIMRLLRDKGLLDDAIVAITADHGELLGEEGRVGHSRAAPLEGLVNIPLLLFDSQGVRYPRHDLVSHIDIAPTLLARIGAPIPGHWGGQPLTSTGRRAAVAMEAGTTRAVVAVRDGQYWKYEIDRGTGRQSVWDLGSVTGVGRPRGEPSAPSADAPIGWLRKVHGELLAPRQAGSP